MKADKTILEFLKSGKNEEILNIDNEQIKVSSVELKHGLKLIFRHTSDNYDNLLLQETKSPLFIVDKDGEILFMPKSRGYNSYRWLNNDNKFIDHLTEEDRQRISSMELKIANECFTILKENLSIIDKKILETIDLEEYREDAIKRFKEKQELTFPLQASDIIFNQDIIADYFYDKKSLSQNIFSCLSQRKLYEYERYIAHKECIRQYKKALESNPELKGLNDICTAVNGSVQSFTIHYTNLKGEHKKHSFKKNVSKMDLVNKTILNHQVLDTIPIESIDKITWRNDVLYDAKKYDKLKFSEEQTASRFILLGHSDDVKSIHFDNEKIMTSVILTNPVFMDMSSPRLLSSNDFIINLMKNIKSESNQFLANCMPGLDFYELRSNFLSKKYIFLHTSPVLKNTKEFIMNYLNVCGDNDYNSHYNIGFGTGPTSYTKDFFDCITPFTTSFEFCKFLIENAGVEKIIDLIPEEFVNKDKMIETLQGVKEKSRYSFRIYDKINSIENLQKLFDEREIRQSLCYLHDNVLKNREFILDNITPSSNPLTTSVIYDLYYKDEEIIDKIINTINHESDCKKFLNYAHIRTTDSFEIFQLCNKNINFFSTLMADDVKIFMDGEFSDVESIDVSNNDINITTPNCVFNINRYGNITIINRENPDNKFSLNLFVTEIDYIQNTISEKLKENFKLRSRIFNSVVDETVSNYHKKDIEEER